MSGGGASSVPIAGALGLPTAAVTGGGAVTRGLPGQNPGFYTFQQPQPFRAPTLTYSHPSMHYNFGNMAALALIGNSMSRDF